MTTPTRTTREERRLRTRAELLEAAAVVFARHGYHATSVDMVAEAAGYTKGAVYSNFDSKEELFLALLDQHLEAAVRTVDEIVAATAPAERGSRFAQQRERMTVFDRDWFLLETEFLLYAARNETARERLADRQRQVRRRIATLVERHLGELGIEGPVGADDIALALSAVGDGLRIARLTQPEIDTERVMAALIRMIERGAAG